MILTKFCSRRLSYKDLRWWTITGSLLSFSCIDCTLDILSLTSSLVLYCRRSSLGTSCSGENWESYFTWYLARVSLKMEMLRFLPASAMALMASIISSLYFKPETCSVRRQQPKIKVNTSNQARQLHQIWQTKIANRQTTDHKSTHRKQHSTCYNSLHRLVWIGIISG